MTKPKKKILSAKKEKVTNVGRFLLSPEGKQYLLDRYVNGTDSVYSLAKELGCYENKLYRAMRKHGIERKSKGEAQKIALATGRFIHPTAGRERTSDEKAKIGKNIHLYWENIPKEILEKRVETCRKLWYDVPEAERKILNKKAFVALRQASEHGSKFEKYLLSALLVSKYIVQPHKKFLFENTETSVDIFFPVDLICVELNGPSHYLPIWGQESLDKTIERDLLKVEQLLGCGYKVVIIQNPKGYHSKTVMRLFTEKFLKFIEKVKNSDKDYHEIFVEV